MQNSFKDLVRRNFYISLQPNQIIRAKNGNFGLKRQMNKTLIKNTTRVKHGRQDSDEVLRALELGFKCKTVKQDILSNEYYFKNFTGGKSLKPLNELNTQEFKEWCDYAKIKKEEFKTLLEDKKLMEHEYSKFLGLDRMERQVGQMPMNYLEPESSERKVVGRILGIKNSSTLLVGVQGFVCELESINIPPKYGELRKILQRGVRNINIQKEYDFFVLECFMNGGDLVVKLGLDKGGFKREIGGDNEIILDKIMNMIKQSK